MRKTRKRGLLIPGLFALTSAGGLANTALSLPKAPVSTLIQMAAELVSVGLGRPHPLPPGQLWRFLGWACLPHLTESLPLLLVLAFPQRSLSTSFQVSGDEISKGHLWRTEGGPGLGGRGRSGDIGWESPTGISDTVGIHSPVPGPKREIPVLAEAH